MPTGHGVRVDDEQAARPHGPRTSKGNPESPFRVFERWAWALFLQRRHLLPQSNVLPTPGRRGADTSPEWHGRRGTNLCYWGFRPTNSLVDALIPINRAMASNQEVGSSRIKGML